MIGVKKINQIKSIRVQMQILASLTLLIAYTATANVFGNALSIYITTIFSVITLAIGLYYYKRSKRTSKLPASLLVSIITALLFILEEIFLRDKLTNSIVTQVYVVAFLVTSASIYIRERRYNIDLKLINQSIKTYQQNRIFLIFILGIISTISILVVYRNHYTIEGELPYFIASYSLMSLVCFALHNEFILAYTKIDDILKDGIVGIFNSNREMVDVAIDNKKKIKVSAEMKEFYVLKTRSICCNGNGMLLTKIEVNGLSYYDTPYSTLCKYNNNIDTLPQKSIKFQEFNLTEIARYDINDTKPRFMVRVFGVDDNAKIIADNIKFFTSIDTVKGYIKTGQLAPQLIKEINMVDSKIFPEIDYYKTEKQVEVNG